MTEWIDFKKSFTQKQEDALWQYFIDHSKIQPNGFYGVMFYVRDVDDFFKRLYARYTGDFQRYDKLEKQNKNEQLFIHIQKKMLYKKQKRIEHVEQSRNLYYKVVLWLYKKTRDVLFKG